MKKRVIFPGCPLGCAAILAVLVVFLRLLSHVANQSHWPAPIEGVRLVPARPHLAEDDVAPDNAYYYIRQLPGYVEQVGTRCLREELAAYTTGKKSLEACDLLDGWMARHPDYVELIQRIAAADFSQVATVDDYNEPLSYISAVLFTARLLAYTAAWTAAQGDWETAAQWYLLGLDLGDKTASGAPLIGLLVAHATYGVLLTNMRDTAWEHPPPDQVARHLVTALLDHGDIIEDYAEALRYEHLATRRVVDLAYTAPEDLLFMTDYESPSKFQRLAVRALLRTLLFVTGNASAKTAARVDAVYTHMIHAVENGEMDSFHEKLLDDWLSHRPTDVRFFLTDPLGRLLLLMLVPISPRDRALFASMHHEATATILGIIRYREDHRGTLPERLEQLVPDYIVPGRKHPNLERAATVRRSCQKRISLIWPSKGWRERLRGVGWVKSARCSQK